MKKTFIMIILLQILALVITACGGGTTTPTITASTSTASTLTASTPTTTTNTATITSTTTTVTTTPTSTTVITNEPVLRTVIWTDSDFNELSHILTGNAPYEYELSFIANNQMKVTSVINLVFGVEMRDSKLVFTDVPEIAWVNIFYTARQYLSYDADTKTMTTNALPAEVLNTMFTPTEKSLPKVESLSTSEGKITITYYSTEK